MQAVAELQRKTEAHYDLLEQLQKATEDADSDEQNTRRKQRERRQVLQGGCC